MDNKWSIKVLIISVVALIFVSILGLAIAAPSADTDKVLEAKEIKGQPLKVNGKEVKLWVKVYPARNARNPGPSRTSLYCNDGNQEDIVPQFAYANPSGLTFNINRGSIPNDETAIIDTIHESFETWDSIDTFDYFRVIDDDGAFSPILDGTNSIGWRFIAPRDILAATWVWTDSNNVILETDIFFNRYHKWGVFTTCDENQRFEVGNVAVHEIGHTVGLDHLIDDNMFATMYPSGSKGEVRKRTLTQGDIDSYLLAGGS